ncbi:hypothetical protein B8W95_14075, partial [Staphylococcus pasteuri]
ASPGAGPPLDAADRAPPPRPVAPLAARPRPRRQTHLADLVPARGQPRSAAGATALARRGPAVGDDAHESG